MLSNVESGLPASDTGNWIGFTTCILVTSLNPECNHVLLRVPLHVFRSLFLIYCTWPFVSSAFVLFVLLRYSWDTLWDPNDIGCDQSFELFEDCRMLRVVERCGILGSGRSELIVSIARSWYVYVHYKPSWWWFQLLWDQCGCPLCLQWQWLMVLQETLDLRIGLIDILWLPIWTSILLLLILQKPLTHHHATPVIMWSSFIDPLWLLLAAFPSFPWHFLDLYFLGLGSISSFIYFGILLSP